MSKKIKIEKEEVIWEDRKRRFGMPLSFTRYKLLKDRLILKIGFFNTTTDETMLYRIMDIKLSRKLGQKIFGVGTVILMSADKSHPTLELKNIKQSDQVRKLIGQHIECERNTRGMTSGEFLGGMGRGHHDHCNHTQVVE